MTPAAHTETALRVIGADKKPAQRLRESSVVGRVWRATCKAAKSFAVFVAMFIGAVLCLVAAYLELQGVTTGLPKFAVSALEGLGTAFFAGGVFAWLTKIAQLQGAIRSELEAVVYSPEHLAVRDDVEDLWVNASRAMHNGSFSEISDQIYRKIKSEYLPLHREFYYKDAQRTIEFDLIDPAKKIVQIKSIFEATLVPDRSRRTIHRVVGISRLSHPADWPDPTISSRFFSASDRAQPLPIMPRFSDGGGAELRVMVDLPTDRTYYCVDTFVYYQSLDADNYVFWRSASFVNKMVCSILFDPDRLHVQFRDMGSVRFLKHGEQLPQCIRMGTQDLIFPQEGYIISMQAKPSSSNGPKRSSRSLRRNQLR